MLGNFPAQVGAQSISTAGLTIKGAPLASRNTTWTQCLATLVVALLLCAASIAQSAGNAGSINGMVIDQSGAVVPDVTVQIHNPVSQYDRTGTTDNDGRFSFPNVPSNNYHLSVTGPGFVTFAQDVEVRSTVPISLKITLQVGGAAENITVQSEAGVLLENDPTFHTDVDRQLFDKLPLESSSSELSSLVTLATPGVSADYNGMFHGMGDHAENSF